MENYANPIPEIDHVDERGAEQKDAVNEIGSIQDEMPSDIEDTPCVNDLTDDDEPAHEGEREIKNALIPTSYEEALDLAKIKGMGHALADEETMQQNISKNIEILQEELDLEQSKIELQKLKIEKGKLEVEAESQHIVSDTFRTKYGAKLDQQEYYFRSLYPIMKFARISRPMNVFVMWGFSALVFVPFFVAKACDMVIGNPVRWFFGLFRKEEKGIEYKARLDDDTPKSAKK